MEYTNNKVLTVLERNSVLKTCESKSTKSIYFYWKDYSFRYSDHRTLHGEKGNRYYIMFNYSPEGFWMRSSKDTEYSWMTEDELYLFLKRLEKKDQKRIKRHKPSGKRREKVLIEKSRRTRKQNQECQRGLREVSVLANNIDIRSIDHLDNILNELDGEKIRRSRKKIR